MPIGRFLEISLPVGDIRESLAFYEHLGFAQALAGDSWPHPYAVVTDGRLVLGLHQAPLPGILLTYVLPGLDRQVERLESLGFGSETLRLGNEDFNRMTFAGPGGQRIMLVEARTFSPPGDGPGESLCGYFSEFGMPAREPDATAAAWERLGFVALDAVQDPFPRRSLVSEALNLGLYRTRAFREPLLVFEEADMARRLDRLRQLGITTGDEMPDALEAGANAVLTAPEGTRLLLLEATAGIR